MSVDELTASDDNNSYWYSILVCLNACKLYHVIPSLITEVVTTASAVDVNPMLSWTFTVVKCVYSPVTIYVTQFTYRNTLHVHSAEHSACCS